MSRGFIPLAVLIAAVSPAAAERTADDYHRAGEAAYRGGDFTAAVAAFEEAYRLNRRAQTVFSLAQAYRQVYVANHEPGILLRAVELYRQYLVEVPRGGRSTDARELLSTLDPLVELQRLKNPGLRASAIPPATQILVWSTVTGARAHIAGKTSELPTVADVSPGGHAVLVSAPGHADAELNVTAVADRLIPIEARLTALPARLTIATQPGAMLVVDGVPRSTARDALELPAGTHRVWVGARGRLGAEQTLMLSPGEQRRFELVLEVSPRRERARWTLIGAAVLAGASAATFGYSVHRADGASNLRGVLDDRPWTEAELATYTGDRDAAGFWRNAGIGLLAATVITSAIGTWLWFDDVPAPSR